MSRLYCDPKSRMTTDPPPREGSAARRAARAAAQLSSPGSASTRSSTLLSLKGLGSSVDSRKLAPCYTRVKARQGSFRCTWRRAVANRHQSPLLPPAGEAWTDDRLDNELPHRSLEGRLYFGPRRAGG